MSRLRTWSFRLLALLVVPIVVLLVAEGILRVSGYGHDTRFLRSENEAGRAVLRDNPGFYTLFFPAHLRPVQLPFALATPKPESTLRIALLGGSAAMGIPEPAYAMGPLLEEQLRHRHPGRDVEVLNLANTAINSHVVRRIAREIAPLDPDLILVYLGNNEVVGPFGAGSVLSPGRGSQAMVNATLRLRSTRLGQLLSDLGTRLRGESAPKKWRGMEMFVEQRLGAGDPRLQRVHANFERNLEAICDAAADMGIPVVLSTVGVNVRDCSPFASLHSEGANIPAFEEAMKEGDSAWAAQEAVAAREGYLRARDLDSAYADLHYRLGRLAALEADTALARASLLEAVEQDALRFRADSPIRRSVYEVAARAGATLAPTAEVLERASVLGLPGREFFWEHVHLNFSGNHRASLVLTRAVERALGDRLGAPSPANFLSAETCAQRLGYTPYQQAHEATQILAMLERPPFTGQTNRAEQILGLRQELEGLGSIITPDSVRAWWPQVEAASKSHPGDWIYRFRAAEYLDEALGRPGDAEPLWRGITQRHPDFAAALNGLARSLARQERFAEALALLERSLEIDTTQTDVLLNLGYALRELHPLDPRERDRALDFTVRALTLEDTDATLDQLVQVYVDEARWHSARGDTGKARELVRKAAALERRADIVTEARQELGL